MVVFVLHIMLLRFAPTRPVQHDFVLHALKGQKHLAQGVLDKSCWTKSHLLIILPSLNFAVSVKITNFATNYST